MFINYFFLNYKMIKDKKGQQQKTNYLAFFGVILLIIILLYIFWPMISSSFFIDTSTQLISVDDILIQHFHPSSVAWTRFVNVLGGLLSFVIGDIPSNMLKYTNDFSALIIVACMWAMMILIFGDVLKLFSSLTPKIAWGVAILLGVIAANLTFLAKFAAALTQIFIGLGVFAVYASLFASFVAFFAVEWGMQSLRPWIIRRRSMQLAANVKTTTQNAIAASDYLNELAKHLGNRNN